MKRLCMAHFSCNLIFMLCLPLLGLRANPPPCMPMCVKLVRASWGLFRNPIVHTRALLVMKSSRGKKLLGSKPLRPRTAIDSSSIYIFKMPLKHILTPASAGLAALFRAILIMLISTPLVHLLDHSGGCCCSIYPGRLRYCQAFPGQGHAISQEDQDPQTGPQGPRGRHPEQST